ncbi:hypothetical protein CRE_15941 [Caenorhabditis remanei]|uniref:Serpentine receptor class r-10 n=1 Tax=Caenorhabditis remanei TaxID=31234 RepID=E3MBP0_CAERE|nr:hypothetical protein CRE_15941 [Caenorhabditis remanei]
MTMPIILRISQYFGFIYTEISTLLLLWLIINKSSKNIGSYRYLMLSFSLFSFVYAIVEILTQPIIVLHEACLMVYADSFLKHHKTIAQAGLGLYGASYELCISLLATHFVYRFLAICRPNDLNKLSGCNLLKLYILPIFFSAMWFLINYIPCGPSDLKAEYMRKSVFEHYNEDTRDLGYMAILYYELSIITILVCGYKTYQKMQQVGSSMSAKTKELNNQLFKTLILQTLVPMFLMFTPVGLLLILPMFSMSLGTLANTPSQFAAFYPALDATIAIFMIREFREAVICRRRRQKIFFSTKSGMVYSVSTNC